MAISRKTKAAMVKRGLVGYAMYRQMFKAMSKFAQRSMKRVGSYDGEYWLHRAGLTRYRPARRTMGSIGMLVLGGIAGAIAALALAPKPGVQLRSDVRDRARKMMERPLGRQAPLGEARA